MRKSRNITYFLEYMVDCHLDRCLICHFSNRFVSSIVSIKQVRHIERKNNWQSKIIIIEFNWMYYWNNFANYSYLNSLSTTAMSMDYCCYISLLFVQWHSPKSFGSSRINLRLSKMIMIIHLNLFFLFHIIIKLHQ